MTKSQIKILTFAGVVSLILLISFTLIFSEKGFYVYIQAKEERDALKISLDSLRHLNDSLKAEIEELKTSEFKIEKVAREKYGMVKPGEKVYIIEKNKND